MYLQYKGNICNRAFKCGSELPEYVALILRNGGSQSPDRWLRKPQNNHKRLHKKKACYDVLGFLCIDSMSTVAFLAREENYNVNIAKAVAAQMYVILNQYRQYLKKLTNGRN